MAKNRANDHSKYTNWIDPNEVIPYEKNAKRHDEKQVLNIANSIKRFGWQQDTVITSDNVLVIGHGRRLAAIELGCEMPYHRIDKMADELTDKDIRELRIADNKTNESPWDWENLEFDTADLEFDGFEFDLKDAGGVIGDGDGVEPQTDSQFHYQEQYAVTVMCKSEEDQKNVYEALTAEGYECKVVCV